MNKKKGIRQCEGCDLSCNGISHVNVCVSQGRSLRDSTLRRAQRRSFTPASFMEEDMVDFPDELDTSFFARVGKTTVLLYCFLGFLDRRIILLSAPLFSFFSLLHLQDILMHEELSTFADEVFESPSEAAEKEAEPSINDEMELTGSALDKSALERSHLML